MMKSKTKSIFLWAILGMVVGVAIMMTIDAVYSATSTNESCMSCHFHETADQNYKMGLHYNNDSGVKTDCAQCHLPSHDNHFEYFFTKAWIGIKDIWSYLFKDKESIDWDSKRELDYATGIVYNANCRACHVNLYPSSLTDEGITSHLYYDENEEKLNLQCISCHLNAGHFMENYSHSQMSGVPVTAAANSEIYQQAAALSSFSDFTETIPGTPVSISMKAVKGGSFTMGSPSKEALRQDQEGPQKQVTVSDFFMGEYEVTWDQYWAFYNETMSEGRTAPEVQYAINSNPEVDAVSGPTPPFGNPDQGWGMGERPALTMTHYAAETFCQWLSLKTGKTYRLPTEAEWEYAARGGTDTPYFFEGSPKSFSNEGFLRKFFAADTTMINRYVIYQNNSNRRTHLPSEVLANPFGLKNMLGNALEYCQDFYQEDAYASLQDGAVDPKGPSEGTEHVVRGGMYSDDAALVRSASRGSTHHDDWLKTDPQNPKSIWWYSDIKAIGFRVVCEVPENIK